MSFSEVFRSSVLPQEGHPLDNLLLEIKSYKFAQNRDFKDCMRPTLEVVLDLAGAGTVQVHHIHVCYSVIAQPTLTTYSSFNPIRLDPSCY